MTDLFELYGDQKPDKNSSGADLFEMYKDEAPKPEEETGTPLEIARKRIKKQYPDMPDWLRESILKITPTTPSPRLEAAGNEAQKYTDFISPGIGGALQGASLPIRGVSGLIPTEFTQNLSNAPDLRSLFQQPKTQNQKNVQTASEFLGGAGGLGKLFQGLSAANKALKVPKMLQTPLTLAETGAIGTPGNGEDRTMGAGGALALGSLGSVAGKVAKKAPEIFRGLFNKPNPEEAVQLVQKAHDKKLFEAEEAYGVVRNAIKSRNIKIPVNEELINKSEEIFGNTRPNRKLIDAARSGDYESVHDLQSKLFKQGTKSLASDDPAIYRQGEEMMDLRNHIIEDLEKHLTKEGHADIVQTLRAAKKSYANLKNTFFGKNLKKGIGKLVHPDTRLVPEKPLDLFKENSVPMKEFIKKFPEIGKHLQSEKDRESAMKALKALGWTSAGVTGTKTIYDLFK